MQISAHSRHLDYPAKSIYARADRRLPGDDLIRQVGERTEDERRRAAARRRPIPSPFEDTHDGESNVVPVPFAVNPRPDANAEVVQIAPTVPTTALWALIDAVEAGGTSSASPEKVETPEQSPAESLYLLLAQVIAED